MRVRGIVAAATDYYPEIQADGFRRRRAVARAATVLSGRDALRRAHRPIRQSLDRRRPCDDGHEPRAGDGPIDCGNPRGRNAANRPDPAFAGSLRPAVTRQSHAGVAASPSRPTQRKPILPSKSELSSRHIFVAFWAAYLLVLSLPDDQRRRLARVDARARTRARERSGLLTSAYFVAFAAVQLPAGVLLDRFGPRRVEPALLVVGGTGALFFAYAESTLGLVVARAMIGAGVAVCLMAPLKAIATWVPRERQASIAGWVMTAGSAGALLAAATPTEFALRYVHWRTLFLGLASRRSSSPRGSGGACPTRAKPVEAQDSGTQWASRAEAIRASAVLVDRAARRLLHGLVLRGPGTLVGALADRSQRLRSRRRGAASLRDGNRHVRGISRARDCSRPGSRGTAWARDTCSASDFALNILAFAAIVQDASGHLFLVDALRARRRHQRPRVQRVERGFRRRVRRSREHRTQSAHVRRRLRRPMGHRPRRRRGARGVRPRCGRADSRSRSALVLALDVLAYAWFAWGWRRHAPFSQRRSLPPTIPRTPDAPCICISSASAARSWAGSPPSRIGPGSR